MGRKRRSTSVQKKPSACREKYDLRFSSENFVFAFFFRTYIIIFVIFIKKIVSENSHHADRNRRTRFVNDTYQ